jgi:tetratricopeptide (TPR) repeat protein
MLRRLFGGRARDRYGVGIDHFNAGRLAEAIGCFDDAIAAGGDADPDVTLARFYRGEAHARLGRACLEDGEPAQALEHVDAALRDHPAYPDLHLQRAIALLELEDDVGAEDAARRALEINEDLVDAALVRVIASSRGGRTARARELSSEWHERASRQGSPLAELFLDPETALQGLRAHRARQVERRRKIERAEALLHEGLWAQAQELLEPLLEQTPHFPDLRLRMAACVAAQGDPETASAHLDAALERNPDFADARVLAGIVDLRRSRVRRAAAHFAHAEGLGNASSPARYGAALCDLRAGDLDGARRRLETVWETEHPGVEARFLRAALTALTGDAGDATRQYVELVASTDAVPLLLDAAAWGLVVGRPDLVRRALEACPADATPVGPVLARARLLRTEGHVERAIDVLEAATAEHPRHPGVLWELARAHAEHGDDEVALRRLANLDATGARVPGSAALTGRLLRRRGDPHAAVEALEAGATAETDPDTALELLHAVRQLGDSEAADRIWAQWAPLTELDLRWRLQDPRRWWGPIPVWPSWTEEGSEA